MSEIPEQHQETVTKLLTGTTQERYAAAFELTHEYKNRGEWPAWLIEVEQEYRSQEQSNE